jgi:hypothetical protein
MQIKKKNTKRWLLSLKTPEVRIRTRNKAAGRIGSPEAFLVHEPISLPAGPGQRL